MANRAMSSLVLALALATAGIGAAQAAETKSDVGNVNTQTSSDGNQARRSASNEVGTANSNTSRQPDYVTVSHDRDNNALPAFGTGLAQKRWWKD
jgi:hypothetical protein